MFDVHRIITTLITGFYHTKTGYHVKESGSWKLDRLLNMPKYFGAFCPPLNNNNTLCGGLLFIGAPCVVSSFSEIVGVCTPADDLRAESNE